MVAPVSEGDILLDKYKVERVLGQGGMGVVVAATHVDLDQKVALKFLLPDALEHKDLVERFAREARAAAKIQSRHVVRVLDTGKMPSGAPFMVMEYLEGEDLSALLRRSGPLPASVVADYLLQACEAIAEAHAAKIVHRDLKPSNLFLAKQRDRRSIIKVLDFGISKLNDAKATPLTQSTTTIGSPHYMSPEQLLSSKTVDSRSDIWSLGVILYELVAGQRPFEGETMPEVVGQILNNEPTRLKTLREDVSLDLELVLAKCLATDLKNRYQSVAELSRALGAFVPDSASATASVARIERVLGGASVPPAALGSDSPRVQISMPDAITKAEAVATTVRPQPLPEPPDHDVSASQAGETGAGRERQNPDDLTPNPGDRDSGSELALASTTPSIKLAEAIPVAEQAGGKRRRLVVAAGVTLAVLSLVGLRVGMRSEGSPNDARPAPASTTSEAPSAPTPGASSKASSSTVASSPSSEASSAPSTAPLLSAPGTSAPPRPTRPQASVAVRPTAPRTAAPTAPSPTASSFRMDIK